MTTIDMDDASAVLQLTKSEMQEFSASKIIPGAPERAEVTVHIVPKAAGVELKETGFVYSTKETTEDVQDVIKWRKRMTPHEPLKPIDHTSIEPPYHDATVQTRNEALEANVLN